MNFFEKQLEGETKQQLQSTGTAVGDTLEELTKKISTTIISTFKKAIAEGKNDKVVRILMGKDPIPHNSITGEAINAVKTHFADTMKLSETEAEIAAGKIVPGVMNSWVNKNENGEEQLRDIMQTLGGSLMGDIGGKFGKYIKGDEPPLKNLF